MNAPLQRKWKLCCFPDRLREAAGRRGVAEAVRLGCLVGVGPEVARRWLDAEAEPSLFWLGRIALVLGCTTDFLLGVHDD